MRTGKPLGGFKLHDLIYILKDHFGYLLGGEQTLARLNWNR